MNRGKRSLSYLLSLLLNVGHLAVTFSVVRALFGGIWITVMLSHLTSSLSAQSTQDIPVPEFYGIYAVVDGKLLDIKGRPSTMTPITQEVRYTGAGFGLELRKVPLLPSTVKFVFYSPPYSEVGYYELKSAVYLRTTYSSDAVITRLYEDHSWIVKGGSVELLFKPVPGRPEMKIGVPPEVLSPGVYSLGQFGEEFVFAVGPLTKGEINKCVDHFIRATSSELVPCTASEPPPAPTTYAVVPGGLCTDYDSCLKSSLTAFQARQWDTSFSYSEEASRLAPERGEAYVMMAGVYFERGDYNKFYEMADKGLSLGSPAAAKVCRDRFGGCEQGTLLLSSQEVALTNTRQQKVFSAPPSEVTSRPATLYTQASAAYSQLTVAGKNYRLYLIPEAVQCQIDLAVVCPEPGFTQQKVFANYVHHAIQGLASGTLAKAPESSSPASPTSQPPAPTSPVVGFHPPTGQANAVRSLGWLGINNDFPSNPFHLGVDFPTAYGARVYSIAEGKVVLARTDVGKYGGLDHPGGGMFVEYRTETGQTFYALYAHIENMKAGGCVKAGEQIATVGHYYDTNGKDGPHLHFAVFFGDQLPSGDTWPWRQYVSSPSDNPGWQDPLFVLNNMKPGTGAACSAIAE